MSSADFAQLMASNQPGGTLTPEQKKAIADKAAADKVAADKAATDKATADKAAADKAAREESERVAEAERKAAELRDKIARVEKYRDSLPPEEAAYKERVNQAIIAARATPPQTDRLDGLIGFLDHENTKAATRQLGQDIWNGLKWSEMETDTVAGRTMDNAWIAGTGWLSRGFNVAKDWLGSMADPNDGYADNWGPTLLKAGGGVVGGMMLTKLISPAIDKIPVLGWSIFSWIPKLAAFVLGFLGGGKAIEAMFLQGNGAHVPRDMANPTVQALHTGQVNPAPAARVTANPAPDANEIPAPAVKEDAVVNDEPVDGARGAFQRTNWTAAEAYAPARDGRDWTKIEAYNTPAEVRTAAWSNPNSYVGMGNGSNLPRGYQLDTIGYQSFSHADVDNYAPVDPAYRTRSGGNMPAPQVSYEMA